MNAAESRRNARRLSSMATLPCLLRLDLRRMRLVAGRALRIAAVIGDDDLRHERRSTGDPGVALDARLLRIERGRFELGLEDVRLERAVTRLAVQRRVSRVVALLEDLRMAGRAPRFACKRDGTRGDVAERSSAVETISAEIRRHEQRS